MQTKIRLGIFIIFTVVVTNWISKQFQSHDKIRIVFGGGFEGGVSPIDFKTVHGAYVSDLVFPTLVGTLDIKQYYPRLVENWEANEEDTLLSFSLDPKVSFSNGDPLRCQDIKNSIENSLSIKKTRNDVRDDFKLLKGYQDNSDRIEGIKCPDPLLLEFHSTHINPNLLEAISHSDMGIYKKVENTYLGCGKYILEKHVEDYVLLKLNQKERDDSYSPKFIEYFGSDTYDAKNADVFVAYSPQLVPSIYKSLKKFELTWMALILHLYRHEKSLFSDVTNRKAFLSLLWQNNNLSSLVPKMNNKNFTLDPQPFLKLQLGRLNDSDAEDIIFSGTKEISSFIKKTKKNPLKFVHTGSQNCLDIMENLKDLGLFVDSELSRKLSFNDLDFEPADIQCVSHSAALVRKDMIRYSTGDPQSPPFEDLLSIQKGRNDMSKGDLREYLQKINRAILGKVPFIKIGQTPVVAYYNEKKVGVRQITHSSRANSLLDRFYLITNLF